MADTSSIEWVGEGLATAHWRPWMQLACQVAAHSPDPSTQNGAVLVADARMAGQAWNEVPHCCGPWSACDDAFRRARTVHAETGAIYTAAATGARLRDAVMVCPWAACIPCALAIAAVGLRCLIVSHEHMQRAHPAWDAQIAEALGMLQRAGVRVRQLSVRGLDIPPLRFRGVVEDLFADPADASKEEAA